VNLSDGATHFGTAALVGNLKALSLPRYRVVADAGAKDGVKYSTDNGGQQQRHARAVSGPGRCDVGAVVGATAGVSLG